MSITSMPSLPDMSQSGASAELSTNPNHCDQKLAMTASTSSLVTRPLASKDPRQASTVREDFASEQENRASRLQVDWKDAICRNMHLPEGYAQVAVLLIEWAEHLDGLHTKDEVVQLETLFRDEFHYETEIVSLREESPTHQLRGSVSRFLERYDRPNNLLIIYYTGHSAWNKNDNELEFWAKNMEPTAPNVQWKCTEKLLLEEVSADTLAILDTCFASNPTKGGVQNGRTYQLLAASGYNRFTAGPGERSFTAALIASLKDCLKEGAPFSVWRVLHEINKSKYRRNNPAEHHDRLGSHSRHILLAPLNKDKTEREETERQLIECSGIADLVLRFNLGVNDLSKEHIEELSKRLPKIFSDIRLDLRRIELDGLTENRKQALGLSGSIMAVHAGQWWLKKTRRGTGSGTFARHQRPSGDGFEQVIEPRPSLCPSPTKYDNTVTKQPAVEKPKDVSLEANLVIGATQRSLTIAVVVFGMLSCVNALIHLFTIFQK